nr:homocysteine S-methyltransferase family protein [uncultured Albidiferax sp.]
MAKQRRALPQMSGKLFLTDGGIETTLIFLEGLELPLFAAFHLLRTEQGEAALAKYFQTYAVLAQKHRSGLVLETATWRASVDWGHKLGYTASELAEVNRRSVAMLEAIRAEYETADVPIVISGCIGPRGDGYVPSERMSVKQAEGYHNQQIETFADTSVDLVTAITMNYVEEAIGLVHAARQAQLPVVISLTVETDGRLPTGQPLGDAITEIDAATTGYPSYFMINCAHPSHFSRVVECDEAWRDRIHGLRANASKMSHAELNEAQELDAGDPEALGRDYALLRSRHLKCLNVFGGCCGTDHRHVDQMALACLPLFRGASSRT